MSCLNNFSRLPQLERDKLVDEWKRLVGREDKIAQLAQFSKVGAGRGNKGGESEAARQLGLDRDDVRRAAKVASITPEAQQAAHEVGIWWTSSFPARQNCFTQKRVARLPH